MIDNKDKSDFVYEAKALKMTKYQHLLFDLIEKKDLTKFAKIVSKKITKEKPPFIISIPLEQYLFTKLYLLINWLLFL